MISRRKASDNSLTCGTVRFITLLRLVSYVVIVQIYVRHLPRASYVGVGSPGASAFVGFPEEIVGVSAIPVHWHFRPLLYFCFS